MASNPSITTDPAVAAPMTEPRSHFEVRQTAKGMRVYDIKVYLDSNDGAGVKAAMDVFDRLDGELSKRVLMGE